ncbi:MAG TPA: hypothetical protein PKA00_17275 [Saprospiraceae bacterium]|mgnify:CR=1 FL=1|nr:hypothetical protein [Saprospiraceae bacterium]HMQ84672.1 hypothetical protein [Saprospiraceae bacterium]
MQKKGVLVTSSVGHSGTRLIVEMLGKHTDVFYPKERLNHVNEHDFLHQFFLEKIKNTPINKELKIENYEELEFLLNMYGKGHNPGQAMLLKLPFYPLCCLDSLDEYFDDFKIIYLNRKIDNVLKSFLDRNEDQHFWGNAAKRYESIKMLGLKDRELLMNEPRFENFIKSFPTYGEKKIKEFESSKKENTNKILQVQVESISNSIDEILLIFKFLGLKVDNQFLMELKGMINPQRLQRSKSFETKKRIKNHLRKIYHKLKK